MHERDSWLKKNLPVLCLSHLDCLKQLLAVPRLDLGVRLQCEDQSPSNFCTQYLSALARSIREQLPACVDLLLARDDIIVDEDALTAACIEPSNEAGYLGKLLRHRNFSAFSKLVALWPPGCSEDRRRVVPMRVGMSMEVRVQGKGGAEHTTLIFASTEGGSTGPSVLVGMIPGPGYGEALPALSTAARFGRSEHNKALLAAGCPPSGPPGSRGSSPLMCALNFVGSADEASDECIRLLLAAPGIDLGARDADGRTALDWARRIPINSAERAQARVRMVERAVGLSGVA